MGRVKWFRSKAFRTVLRGILNGLRTFIDFVAPYVMNNRKKKGGSASKRKNKKKV